MRVDAARNRAQIVAAARVLVARDGAEMTMEALAERAGVAVGTLYRHFPTKADLVGAVIEESVERLAELADEASQRWAAGGSPGQELELLIRAISDNHASDRAVKQAAASLGVSISMDPRDAPADSAAARGATTIAAMLTAAQAAGEIDPQVTLDDLVMVLSSVPDDARAVSRYVDIVLAGLRFSR